MPTILYYHLLWLPANHDLQNVAHKQVALAGRRGVTDARDVDSLIAASRLTRDGAGCEEHGGNTRVSRRAHLRILNATAFGVT